MALLALAFLLLWTLTEVLTPLGPQAWAQSILQYHFSADRAGKYVVPGLTLQQARSIHLDSAFDGRVDGHVYAQPLLFKAAGREVLVVATGNNGVEVGIFKRC